MADSSNHKHSHQYFLRLKDFLIAFRKTILIWIGILIIIVIGLIFHMDKTVLGAVVLLIGVFTQAFAGLLNIIGLIPFIGPIIAKLLALPLFWLLNSLGYFASLIAIRKGYKRQVFNYRILTIILLTGIIIGYILGKIF